MALKYVVEEKEKFVSICKFEESTRGKCRGKSFQNVKVVTPCLNVVKAHLLLQRVVLKLCLITPYVAAYIAD